MSIKIIWLIKMTKISVVWTNLELETTDESLGLNKASGHIAN